MKKIKIVSLLVVFVSLIFFSNTTHAYYIDLGAAYANLISSGLANYCSRLNSIIATKTSDGYSCTRSSAMYFAGNIPSFACSYNCTKTVYSTYLSSYAANKDDYRTLTGYANYLTAPSVNTASDSISALQYALVGMSPFIYFQNSPEGEISFSLGSEFNTYYPKPAFNQKNGWILNSKGGEISLDGEKKDNLFYELQLSKITLNRNGKNFASKEDLSAYLQNSDFLTKLGFSEIEKKNSLDYFLPKLKEAEEKSFYYLTVLSDQAIAEISELNIDPKPESIIRQYFAVYPTAIPVKAEGDFIFPKNKSNNLDDFTAKETGEFLIQDPMQVFFE